MVTAKPPSWREPLLRWNELPPTLGEPHEGFFYPDPLGFWAEVRRWAAVLVREAAPGMSLSDVLSVTTLLQAGEDATHTAEVMARCRPAIRLYLDEASLAATGEATLGEPLAIPDPHRSGTVYEGWWARTADRSVVGKAPQHPAAHNFYRAVDMDRFLRAAPTPLAD